MPSPNLNSPVAILLVDTNGVPYAATGGGGGAAFSASNSSQNTGTVSFANSNGVSFGLNAGTMTASVAAAGGAQTGISSIADSANTQTAGMLSFSNAHGVSFGLATGPNTGTLTASIATSLTNINVSAGATSNNLSALTFSNANGVSFGLNASTITGSIATSLTAINLSAGTTSSNASAFTFSNANGVSFGLNGATVTGSVAAGHTDSTYVSYYELWPARGAIGTTNLGAIQASNVLVPFVVGGEPVSAYRGAIIASFVTVTSTYSASIGLSQSQQSTTFTGSIATTFSFGLFSRQSTGTNANSSNLISFTSTQVTASFGVSQTQSCATNVSTGSVSATVSWQMGFINNIDSAGNVTTSSTGSSYSSSGSTTSTNASTSSTTFVGSNQLNYLTGLRPVVFPMPQSLSPGEYWFLFGNSTGAVGQANCYNLARPAEDFVGFSSYGASNILGSSNTATSNVQQFIGQVNTSATSTTFGNAAMTSANAGWQVPWFQLIAQTL